MKRVAGITLAVTTLTGARETENQKSLVIPSGV